MAKKTNRTKTTARKSPTGRKSPSSKKKASTTKTKDQKNPAAQAAGTAAGDAEVTIDRRRRNRRAEDRGEAAPVDCPAGEPERPLERRQKVNRRRQIDPTTCERDYSQEEVEFMNALDEYKRKSGRMFPTCSEVLEVIRDLGYVKATAGGLGRQSRPEVPADLEPVSE